jgi:GTP-binding protein
MRREGFELTVGKPEVLTKMVDGATHEPTERVTIDVPDEHVGSVTQLLGERRGRLEQMSNHGTGWIRLDYVVPARGLIGFRTEFLTETRGTGLLHHVFEGYVRWTGDFRTRHSGSIVADRSGQTSAYAASTLQDRGTLFVGPGVTVYEGMIIGENPRPDDIDVNICKEKKQTNVRAAAADDAIRLSPPRDLSLEHALEFIADDECVEVTPGNLRLRKVELNAGKRLRLKKRGRQ